MAADPVTGFDPDTDEQLRQDNAAMDAAGDQHQAQQAQEAFTKAAPPPQEQSGGLQHWFTNLPNNIGSGLINAAVNTADAAHSAWKWMDEGQRDAEAQLAAKNGGPSPDARQRAEEADGNAIPTPEYDDVRNAIQNFNQKYVAVQNPTLSDNITQGVAQFGIPFLGWSKAVSTIGGVGKLAAAGRTIFAEAATAATAQGAHDGRFADMVELGKHTEGKFADALNAITPDGSLLNGYLNYMTNHDNEGEFEGRLKNVVDTVTGSAVISPILTAGAKMLKGGMDGLRYSLENGVGSIDQLATPNMEGRIGYHGTPHNFDVSTGFDNSKIGSGEGNQVFGYGHYLAESPDVAKGYQSRLSLFGAPQALQDAHQAVQDAGGSNAKAYTTLMGEASNESGARASYLQKQAQLIKNGSVDKLKGSFVTADVPDEHVNNMLDWDKPLSEQPNVAANLSKIGIDPTNEDHMAMTGKDIHQSFEQRGFSPKGIAGMFDEAGIPGIKYLDGNSRSGAEGTRNLVVFDGKKIKVLKKD